MPVEVVVLTQYSATGPVTTWWLSPAEALAGTFAKAKLPAPPIANMPAPASHNVFEVRILRTAHPPMSLQDSRHAYFMKIDMDQAAPERACQAHRNVREMTAGNPYA
jgi:hypothetical protein